MSSRREPRNVLFSSFDEATSFSQVRLSSQRPPHPASPNKLPLRPSEMERQNIAPNATSPIKYIHTVEFLEQQVKRLQEVIFYVGTNNDKLIIQSDEQQKEIAYLKICQQKTKQQTDAQVRKLKEMLNDKISECQSLANNSRREKDILQKENERIKVHIKSLIQQKNNEVFSLSKEKERQLYEVRTTLENTIEQTKREQREEVEKLKNQVVQLEKDIQLWKEKNITLQNEYSGQSQSSQAHITKILEEHEIDLNQLANKYHRNKLLMLETSQQEVQTLEQSSHIQREAYLFEIEGLKRQIERLELANMSLKERESLSEANFEQNMNDYELLISGLQQKLAKIHRIKEQQLQISKIKAGALHEENLKAVEETYVPRLAFLSDKVNSFEQQIEKLHDVLSKELQKNASLVRKLHIKESRHQQEMAKMKLMYDNAEELMRQKLFSQKSLIMQKSAQLIKNFEMKANSIQFYQQELRKLRRQLEERINENQSKENAFDEERKFWQVERQQLLLNIKTINQNSEKVVRELKGLIDDKSSQIDNLSREILKSIRESPLPDYSKYIEEIDQLKKQNLEKEQVIRVARQKVERAEKKCRQSQQQAEKMRLQGDVIINEAKGEWQVLSQQKLDQIEDFYKKKMEFLEEQRDELNYLNKELEEKVTQLVLRYKELEHALSEMMASVQRRSELEEKVILLGTDINLVKNKEQLFQY